MKKNIRTFCIAFLSLGQWATAQISIEASDLPIPNKSIEIALSDGYGFDLGEPSDVAQTWDFSFLPLVSTKEFNLQSPTNFYGHTSFPAATMAQTTPFTDVLGVSLARLFTLPLQLPPANVFYGLNEDGSINFQGIFANFDIEGATDGDTTSIALEPPFTYYPVGSLGDELSSSGSFFFKVPVDEDLATLVLGTGFDLSALGISLSALDAGITVEVVNQVNIDAHGTLTTPKQAYEVLRFNETMFIDIKINAFLGALDLGQVYTTNAVVKQFRFWAKEQNHPVLTVVEFDEQGGTSTLSVEYINETSPVVIPSSNQYLTDQDFKIYPNPASEQINIGLPIHWQQAQVSILDNLGKKILSQTLTDAQNLSIAHLPSGFYVVEFLNKGQLFYKTLVK